ncbi:MAG: hypothetical protein EP312_03150, partial [Gammaproteobacteria bacterium]
WSLGYRALTEQLCGVMLEDAPHITRSNWLQRPLSPEQRDYAVNDVVYLSRAWPLLLQRLQDSAWYAACVDETTARVRQMLVPQDPEQAWRELGGLERLSDTGLRIARRLYLWREQTAVQDNVARNRLMRDGVLLAISRLQPENLQSLSRIEDMRPGSVRRYGQQILREIDAAVADVADIQRPPSVDPQQMRRLLSPLKKAVARWSEEHGLPGPLLASRTMLAGLVLAWLHGQPLPEWTMGWRGASLVPMLLDVLEKNRELVDTV